MEAVLPPDEEKRLEVLKRYQILDTPNESDFDEVVRLAAQICQVPISLVSLVDRDRQWFKGRYGLEVTETPRRISFCAHTILQHGLPLEVPDATQDPRFADNELVTGEPRIRFYAAAPLVTSDGYALGTLCVIDRHPRHLSPEQREALRVLGRQVMMQMELRRRMAELRTLHAEEQTRLESLVQARTAQLAQANAQLRDSEQRLAGIITSAMDAIISINEQQRVVLFNAAAEKVFGVTAAEVLGQSLDRFLPERFRAAHPRHIENFARTGVSNRHMGRLGTLFGLRANGQEFPIEASISQTEVQGQKLFTVILRDVTARQQAEAELRQSEERLALAIEAAKLGTWDWHLGSGQLVWSPRCRALFGLPPEAPIDYERFLQTLHPEDRPRVEGTVRAILAGHQQDYEMEMRTRWPDGSEHWVASRGRAYCDAAGQPVRMSGAALDITGRKGLEHTLAERARLLDLSFDAIVVRDAQGRISYWNHGAHEMYGWSSAEALGQPIQRLLHTEYPQPLEAILAWVQQHRRWQGELRHTRRDGVQITVATRWALDPESQGADLQILETNTDITERKRAEAALRDSRDELAQANRQLERRVQERTAQLVEANANLQAFAHTAAHDLRSPLRSISGFASIALAQYGSQLDAPGRSLLERVVEATDHMGRLLNDLLEYSKVSQAELHLETVRLDQALRQVLTLLEPDIRARNATIDIASPLPRVLGHPATLVMLLSNFVSNALKFVPPGIPPHLRLWAQEQPGAPDGGPPAAALQREPASASPTPAALPTDAPPPAQDSPAELPKAPTAVRLVRLWVEDNGIGIAPEDLEKVFGAFQRLHDKQTYPGTGLGLAIVRKAAERMGGRVGVQSDLGRGSRFWVELRKV